MFSLLLFLVLVGFLAYRRSSRMEWVIGLAALFLLYTLMADDGSTLMQLIWIIFGLSAVIIGVPILRRLLISDRILALYKKILPPMSQTEQEALEAGTVWWDGELFSGSPDWKKLHAYPSAKLSAEEKAFVDNTVEELCYKLDDWKISAELNDLPEEVWQFIKDNKFFGMIIPKEYGGLGFSAKAHSDVVLKISSRSCAAAVSVMVPNSLGPAELLLRYGTEAQKNHYLPRLAVGDDVPCFALTSPEAGSDASSIPDMGIVCRQDYNGEKSVLGISLTWDKRYITLGPVATILGLAFQLYDPKNLLEKGENLGITLALIPTDHQGVVIGRRHHPLDIGFQNGPNSGKDVFIPMDMLIGGVERVGQGWRMLMECLAAGRTISLPALSAGGAKFSARTMGAYARIRKQFKTPIGYFEGIEEPLARIGGYAYMMDAARNMGLSALDDGESPSVISAILKFNLTEMMRKVVNDAMDIQGGSAICLGPHNVLGKLYHAIPISITVEGANILTRSLIIYGQGAIRSHPYVLKEMNAAKNSDHEAAAKDFDAAICGHISFSMANYSRTLFMGLSGSRFVESPVTGPTELYYKHLTRFSAAFAMVSDFSMLTIGGALKRKEKISGRLADVLSMLFMASSALKRFEEQGQVEKDLPFVKWAVEDCLYNIQEALFGICKNFPNRIVARVLYYTIFPLGRRFAKPNDETGRRVARALLEQGERRNRLTQGVFVASGEHEAVGRMEAALLLVDEADKIEKKIYRAKKQNQLFGDNFMQLIIEAKEKSIISTDEAEKMSHYYKLRTEIISVDDFAPNEFKITRTDDAILNNRQNTPNKNTEQKKMDNKPEEHHDGGN